MLIASPVLPDDACEPGVIEVFDNDNVVQMPWKVKGLFFGPYYGEPGHDSVNARKFIGSLKVDSINFGDGFVPLKNLSQLDSVKIISEKLVEFLKDNRVYYISKANSWFKKKDTIAWDWKGQPQKRRDLTKSYLFRFDSKIEVDTILNRLHNLDLNFDAGCIPIAHLD